MTFDEALNLAEQELVVQAGYRLGLGPDDMADVLDLTIGAGRETFLRVGAAGGDIDDLVVLRLATARVMRDHPGLDPDRDYEEFTELLREVMGDGRS